jgi:hypothetical protein
MQGYCDFLLRTWAIRFLAERVTLSSTAPEGIVYNRGRVVACSRRIAPHRANRDAIDYFKKRVESQILSGKQKIDPRSVGRQEVA